MVFKGGDVFGDGVNIASRLEPLAPVGGILVSESVHRNIQNKKGIESEFVGEETLKNVKDPVRIYDVKIEGIDHTYPTEQNKSKTSNLRIVVFVSLAIIITLFLVYFFYPDQGRDTASLQPADSGIAELSIAVLPFKNFSGDPKHEPFCDAMTDAVISRLTKIEGINKVISMTSVMSYKQTKKTMPEIAAELRVTHILEANFQKSGNHVKINLQLIDGPSDDHFWSSEYNGEWGIGIFAIQAAVAENVAEKMGAQITDVEFESIQKIPTNNEEAYNLFLQAEFQRKKYTKSAFENAIPLYEKAIALDSNFIESYLGLASIWNFGGWWWGLYEEELAWQNAKSLLFKALAIDSTNGFAKKELLAGNFYYEWNFDLVEKHYTEMYEDYRIKTGRFKECLEVVNQMILNDPANGVNYTFKSRILMHLNRRDEAIDQLKKHDPLYNDWWYLCGSAKNHYYLGNYEKFEIQLNRMMSGFPDENPPILFWMNAINYQMVGDMKQVDEYLNKLEEKYETGYSGSPAWFIALYYCHIKDYESAFEWLQKSFDRHEVEMTWFREEPLLIPVREDPRYKELYRKIGFPDL